VFRDTLPRLYVELDPAKDLPDTPKSVTAETHGLEMHKSGLLYHTEYKAPTYQKKDKNQNREEKKGV
jgi:hypothetical protein